MEAEEELYEIQIDTSLKRSAAEAFSLEIRRLARRHGIEVTSVRVEQARDDS